MGCQPSSRRWRPIRRTVLRRALTTPVCSWFRLGVVREPWPGADPHLSVAALLVELEILDLASTRKGEVAFRRRDNPLANERLQRLRALIADHEAHGWPSTPILRQEILELSPCSAGAAPGPRFISSAIPPERGPGSQGGDA